MARCDFDCFHCKYKDCICNDRPTREETEIMHGAHNDWRLENWARIYIRLAKTGLDDKDIYERIGVHYKYMCKVKAKAASLMAQEKRQTKTNTTVL